MTGASPIVSRIGILEDDPELRLYLEQIINEAEGLGLAFSSGTVAAARTCMADARPDLCLVDIGLPDGSGLDFIAWLKAEQPTRCLILTVLGDRESVLSALRSGADGYLLKDTPPEQLRRAIAATIAGETPLSPQAATYLLNIFKATVPGPETIDASLLSAREIEVLKLFSRGLSYRETAGILQVSPHTIGDYVKAIYGKLSVHSRTEAIFEARQLGLIRPLD